MALTVTSVDRSAIGRLKMAILDIDFDASYPTGGESLTASDLGVTPLAVLVENKGGYTLVFDRANEKVLVYRQTDPADAGGADIPLVEVADTADLSGLTGVRVVAVGL